MHSVQWSERERKIEGERERDNEREGEREHGQTLPGGSERERESCMHGP